MMTVDVTFARLLLVLYSDEACNQFYATRFTKNVKSKIAR